jgi:hypothetical protein
MCASVQTQLMETNNKLKCMRPTFGSVSKWDSDRERVVVKIDFSHLSTQDVDLLLRRCRTNRAGFQTYIVRLVKEGVYAYCLNPNTGKKRIMLPNRAKRFAKVETSIEIWWPTSGGIDLDRIFQFHDRFDDED